jgi:hypothetical protein
MQHHKVRLRDELGGAGALVAEQHEEMPPSSAATPGPGDEDLEQS